MWRKEPIEIGEWVHPGRAERCRSESGGVGATPGLSTWNWSLLVTFRQMTHVFFHSSYTSLPNIPTQPQLNGTPKSSRKPCPLTSLIWQYVFSKVRLKGCLVSHIQLIKNSKKRKIFKQKRCGKLQRLLFIMTTVWRCFPSPSFLIGPEYSWCDGWSSSCCIGLWGQGPPLWMGQWWVGRSLSL